MKNREKISAGMLLIAVCVVSELHAGGGEIPNDGHPILHLMEKFVAFAVLAVIGIYIYRKSQK